MRQKFKKISAIAASVLMVGMSIGGAFAASTSTASFPSSFTGSDVAVVYGATAASSDQTASNTITTYLTPKMSTSSTSTSVSGGEVFTIEKTNDKFVLGETFPDAYSSTLDNEDFPSFLADGTYRDGNVDTDYSQKITLGDSSKLSYFKDSKYKNKEQTLGFKFAKDDEVLDYTLEFDNAINPDDMNNTRMPFLGNLEEGYYVKGATVNKITLLDSSETITLTEDSEQTVKGYNIKIDSISEDGKVKFVVNGKSISSLEEGESYKLADGTYLSVIDVMYTSKSTKESKVEFTIGNGEIVLENNQKVKINDKTVENLKATITEDGSGNIESITLNWIATSSSTPLFLTKDQPLLMPGFEKLQFVFDGLDFPSDPETISLDASEVLTLGMGNFDLELLENVSSDTVVNGTNENPLILYWNNGTSKKLDVKVGDRFIITTYDKGENLGDISQGYYEVTELEIDSDGALTSFKLTNKITGKVLEYTNTGKDRNDAGITITLTGVDDSGDDNLAYLTVSETDSGSGLTIDRAISKKGLVFDLSMINDGTNKEISFTEADEDGKLGNGESVVLTWKYSDGSEKFYIDSVDETNLTGDGMIYSEDNKDIYTGYVESALATKVTLDESTSDEKDFSIEYYGEEVPATVKLVADGSVSSSTEGAQVLVIKDSEVTSTESRNLIVVGGSCINTVAQKLLNVTSPLCGSAFTAKTNVGAGQFLIENFNSPYSNGKYALLVAGYDAADTTKAATYLTTSASSLDLTAGNPNIVSSATVVTTTSQ